MAVGGWLCRDREWTILERAWMQRIEFEQRVSVKKGFPPISRYHAADCSSLVNEFSRDKGWNEARQIRFCKKLTEMLGMFPPFLGIAVGSSLVDFLKHYPDRKKQWRQILYRHCLRVCLIWVGEWMDRWLPQERVAIIHDRCNWDGHAKAVFDGLKSSKSAFPEKRYFTTIASMGWEDCVALQPTDFIAYEGFKRFEARQGDREIRRSLRALIGKKIPLRTGWIPAEYWSDLK
jgi:hypothetical protein